MFRRSSFYQILKKVDRKVVLFYVYVRGVEKIVNLESGGECGV